MTAEQLTAEQLRTLDAEVHNEVMGAKWFRVRYDGRERPEWGFESVHLLPADVAARYPNEGWSAQALSPEEGLSAFLAENPQPHQRRVLCKTPRYSTDIAAAWEMEEAINRRGLGTEYGMEIMALVVTPETETGQKPFTFVFDTAHAAPEMRCRAALAAVREAKQ